MTVGRRSGPIALAVAAIISGCSNERATSSDAPTTIDTRSASTSTRVATTTTNTSTTSTTTTTVPTGPVAPWSLESCRSGGAGVVTTTWWLPDTLPAGYELVSASSTGTDRRPPPIVFDGQEDVEFTLVETGADGVVTEVVQLGLGWSVRGNEFSYYSPDQEQAQLTSVRGRPGSIASYVSRGGRTGPLAEWTEDGLRWNASGALTPEALSELLDPLVITTAKVTDRSGRLVQIGRTLDSNAADRGDTSIRLQPVGWDDDVAVGVDAVAPVAIQIMARPVGTSGIGGFPSGGAAVSVGQVLGADTRRPMVGSDYNGVTELADGSIATVGVGANLSLGLDEVRRLLGSLRRVEPGDPRLASLPLIEPGTEPSPYATYCRTDP